VDDGLQHEAEGEADSHHDSDETLGVALEGVEGHVVAGMHVWFPFL
jgi:hypothetical protein